MRQKEQPSLKKSVTIVYGNDPEKRQYLVNKKTAGKSFHTLSEKNFFGSTISFPGFKEDVQLILLNLSSIEDAIELSIDQLIEEENVSVLTPNGERNMLISKPDILINVSSLEPADIEYFGKMEHVSLIPCFSKTKVG